MLESVLLLDSRDIIATHAEQEVFNLSRLDRVSLQNPDPY